MGLQLLLKGETCHFKMLVAKRIDTDG